MLKGGKKITCPGKVLWIGRAIIVLTWYTSQILRVNKLTSVFIFSVYAVSHLILKFQIFFFVYRLPVHRRHSPVLYRGDKDIFFHLFFFFFSFSFFFLHCHTVLQFNQCLLQNDSPCRFIFWFLPPFLTSIASDHFWINVIPFRLCGWLALSLKRDGVADLKNPTCPVDAGYTSSGSSVGTVWIGWPYQHSSHFIGNHKPPRLALKVLRTTALYYSVLQPVVFDWSRFCSILTVRILLQSVLPSLLLENGYLLILCICLVKILTGYLSYLIYKHSRSLRPSSLRCGSMVARLLGFRVWNRPGAWKSLVSVICCQVEVSAFGRPLVHRISTDCGVSECDREASTMRRPWPTGGCRARKWKIINIWN